MHAVYVVSNNSMILYTGTTTDLRDRVRKHKSGSGCAFTSRYHFDRLVFYETFDTFAQARARERQIKNWSRAKKIWLIKRENPQWRDLSEDL